MDEEMNDEVEDFEEEDDEPVVRGISGSVSFIYRNFLRYIVIAANIVLIFCYQVVFPHKHWQAYLGFGGVFLLGSLFFCYPISRLKDVHVQDDNLFADDEAIPLINSYRIEKWFGSYYRIRYCDENGDGKYFFLMLGIEEQTIFPQETPGQYDGLSNALLSANGNSESSILEWRD